jgi:hypothetical protein
MEPVLSLVSPLVSIAICLLPIIVGLVALVVLVVILSRRKPKAASEKAPARQPASAPKAKPAASPKAEAAPQPKPVKLADVATKSCPSCGADNPADNAFCEYCGESLAKE